MDEDRRADEVWGRYTSSFRSEIMPDLLASACLISVASTLDPDTLDLRAATELGLMLLFDKPLLIVVPRGTTIPAALRRAATIVLDDMVLESPDSQARMRVAVRELKAQIR